MQSDYPRPQLVRTEFTSLDGPWAFAPDMTNEGIGRGWFDLDDPFTQTIVVPNPPESSASGIGEDVDSPIWYRREFDYSPKDGFRLFLHFEGVDYYASVWINGIHIGDHEGGQSRFSFDITDAVRSGKNVIVVRAVDPITDLEQPRGKQDWLPAPHVIWYKRTSGIWRSVWLEPVPLTHFERLTFRSGSDLRSVHVEARIGGALQAGTDFEVEFRLRGVLLGRARLACISDLVSATFQLDHEGTDAQPEDLWWTPDSPTLIDVKAKLCVGEVTVDVVASYFGLRTVSTDESNILLNGRPWFLRLVLEQGYWPQSHLASPSIEALETEARLIKSLGFNGVRMHQTSADPRFLAYCDQIGLVVFADVAATYRFSDVALKRVTDELAALIERDFNHPSIVGWVPFNESWGLPDLATRCEQRHAVQAMYSLAKALDPTRLAIGNDGWEYVSGDIVGIHDYAQNPGVLRARYGSAELVRQTIRSIRPGDRRIVLAGYEKQAAQVPVMLTEFGGISVHDDHDAWAAYGEVVATADLPERLGALISALNEDAGLAGYCYTQLTDTAQEKNGLLTETRQPKGPIEQLRAAVLSPRKANRV